MPDIRAGNGREALCLVARNVLAFGNVVSPRSMRTREIEHMTVEITDPTDVLCTGINAGQSREVAAAEAIQLIGGFSDPKFAIAHAPALREFTNSQGEFDGAYGPRLRYQYDDLVTRLKADSTTRQAVLQIWDRYDLARERSKDYPCTLVLGFAIRNDALNLSVVMRSNDVNWGFKNDIFQFTQLQCSIANLLGIGVGRYRHTTFSMHLYERDWAWAGNLDRQAIGTPINDHPTGIHAENPNHMRELAHLIATGAGPLNFNHPSHGWYTNALAGNNNLAPKFISA